jgi:hypothetical protein
MFELYCLKKDCVYCTYDEYDDTITVTGVRVGQGNTLFTPFRQFMSCMLNMTMTKMTLRYNTLCTLIRTDKDECLQNPCRNNGTCYNTYGSYYCECTRAWQGVHCEAGE